MNPEPMTKTIAVRLDKAQREYLLERARLLGSKKISVALRAVLAESMREHAGNGNPPQKGE